jgi:acetyl-CoA carboxylase biotin carboxyl carrier protein
MIPTRSTHRNVDIAIWIVAAILALILALLATRPLNGQATPVPPTDDAEIVYLASPWTGTFYAGAYAGDEPFVRAGSKVKADTIVCMIESARVFAVPAGIDGTIVEVLVEDCRAVVAGDPLFKIRPNRPGD